MPRVTVTAEDRRDEVLLDESVAVCHVDDEVYAVHFLERLAWAIHDGADAEGSRARKRAERRERISRTPLVRPRRKLQTASGK